MNNLKSYFSILTSTLLVSWVGSIILGCANSTKVNTLLLKSSYQSPPITPATEPDQVNSGLISANAIAPSNPSGKLPGDLPQIQTKNTNTETSLGQPISFVSTDWNGDGLEDMAFLITSAPREPKATLLIYLSEAPDLLRLAIRKEDIVWHGSMYGNEAKLSLNDQGSLMISSQNEAIGRGRWNQKIIAMYQDGAFIIAGYTYSYRDTLDPTAGGTCDINFLTRRGVRNDNPFRIDRAPINLIDWTESSIPTECKY